MEPFPIICETCRARLKIRSVNAIGEIHSCPRCGSMVHIVPPPGWTAETQSAPQGIAPVAVAAATVSPVVTASITREMPFAQVPSPSEEAAEAFAEAAAAAEQPIAEFETPSVASDAVAATVTPASGTATIWMLGGGVAAAVVLIGGLGLTMLRGSSPSEMAAIPQASLSSAASTAPAESVDKADNPSPASDEAAAEPEDSPLVVMKPALESELADQSANNSESSVTDLPDAREASDVDAAQPSEPDAAALVEEADQAAPQSAPLASSNQIERGPVLRFDPLDFDPEQLSLSSTTGANSGESSASVPAVASDESALPPGESNPDPEGPDILAKPPESPSITVRLGPMVRGETNPAHVARQFGMRLESLAATGMSLEQFVKFVSNLADVPITIDPTALELAGVSRRTALAVQTGNVTLEELAKAALSKYRLDLVDRDGRLKIALAESGQRSNKLYEVSDLLKPGAANAQEVADIVKRFVLPSSWQGTGSGTISVEGTKLRVEQTKAVQHELLIFCERLRLTRRLAQRSRYPAKLLSIESPYMHVDAKLSERATFTFLPWTRLDDVVRYWEQATGLTMLVDWASLAEAELMPSTPIACSVIDRPWNEALEEIFEPLGLAWWAVNHETIQITTRDAIDTIERVEFFAIPQEIRDQFADSQSFIESLHSELRRHAPEIVAGEPPLLHVDMPSGRLIVRGTPTIHRYLAERLISLSGE